MWPNLSLVINPTNCNYVSLSYQYYNNCYFYFKVVLMKMLLFNKISLCMVSSRHRKAIKRCHMWQSYEIDEPNIFLIPETSVYWNYIQNYRIYLPNENLNSKVIKKYTCIFLFIFVSIFVGLSPKSWPLSIKPKSSYECVNRYGWHNTYCRFLNFHQ